MVVKPLQDSIYEIHGFLAALAQQPRIAIRQDDSRKLAEALTEVGKHMPLPAVKPHHAALAALVWTAGRIYIPMARDIASAKPGSGHNGGPPLDDVVTSAGGHGGIATPVSDQEPAGQWFNLDGMPIQ